MVVGGNDSPQDFEAARSGFAEYRLGLYKDLLGRGEFGTVGRQVEQERTSLLDGVSYGHALVGSEVVDNDNVALPQSRRRDLLDQA